MKEQDAIENTNTGVDVDLIIRYESFFEQFLTDLS